MTTKNAAIKKEFFLKIQWQKQKRS